MEVAHALQDYYVWLLPVSVVVVIGLLWWWMRKPTRKSKSHKKQKSSLTKTKPKKKPQQPAKKEKPSSLGVTKERPLLVQELKAHTDEVCDVCWHPATGELLTACKDRAIRVFSKENLESGASFQYISTGYDYVERCSLVNEKLAVLDGEHKIRLYSLKRGKNGQLVLSQTAEFPSQHAAEIRTFTLAPNGKFLLTCSHEDAIVKLWDLQGGLLTQFDTKKLRNNMACISPNSKFFTVATFTGDVRIWEIVTKKGGGPWEYSDAVKAMDLSGHKSSVYAVCFSPDSHKVVTASKDCTWRMWDIDVRYNVGEDPKCLFSIKTQAALDHIVFSPDQSTIAAATNARLLFYDGSKGQLLHTINSAHGGKRLTRLVWSADSKYLATVAEQDRVVRLWRNPAHTTNQ